MFLVINMAFADLMLGAVALSLYVCLFVGRPYQLWTNEAHLSLNIFAKSSKPFLASCH